MKEFGVLSIAVLLAAGTAGAQRNSLASGHNCDDINSGLCTERSNNVNYEGKYVGHDEPSVLFYSDGHGSGSSNIWKIVLPKDPPQFPSQRGNGATWNFQLHPAFWVGMAVCDSQSFPEYTTVCRPATDANIFDNPNPAASDYIGHHPGTAFMEMQFYPPGWVSSADATRYAAALNIDSYLQNGANNQYNNASCRNSVGDETVNFAFIQGDGHPTGPPDPLHQNAATFTPNAQTLFMNPGDTVLVGLLDTENGLRVNIFDQTTGESGYMVASGKNGFAQVVFAPNATTCTSQPYDFRPMYDTSNEHTRVPWAAHSYNIAFSDEIGHFEFCNAIDAEGGNCTVPGANDKQLDADDVFCFDALASPLVPITGCAGTEFDFDGVPYRNTWPGISNDDDHAPVPSPIRFSSPLFASEEGLHNYSRAAFEADMPGIEFATTPPCNTHTGLNCVNPPKGADFYPIFTTWQDSSSQCLWQLGGSHIPGTVKTFGGSSASEYGTTPLGLVYQTPGGSEILFEDFRTILPSNPCAANTGIETFGVLGGDQ
jgi:hypothetical protein